MHKIVKKRLNEAWTNTFFVETLQEIGFHTLSLMNSTYPSTIWDKSSASYARTLAQYSMSDIGRLDNMYEILLVTFSSNALLKHHPDLYRIEVIELITQQLELVTKETKIQDIEVWYSLSYIDFSGME